jgi:hypothetical protein
MQKRAKANQIPILRNDPFIVNQSIIHQRD